MRVAVEISYYPLQADYEDTIVDFIRRLRHHRGMEVATNPLSTQLSGEYDLVMTAMQQEMKVSLAKGPTASFVIKVLNVGIEPGAKVDIR